MIVAEASPVAESGWRKAARMMKYIGESCRRKANRMMHNARVKKLNTRGMGFGWRKYFKSSCSPQKIKKSHNALYDDHIFCCIYNYCFELFLKNSILNITKIVIVIVIFWIKNTIITITSNAYYLVLNI